LVILVYHCYLYEGSIVHGLLPLYRKRLNLDGGDIILGADDNDSIIGVGHDKIESVVTNPVNLSDNPQKLDPAFILFPQTFQSQLPHPHVSGRKQVSTGPNSPPGTGYYLMYFVNHGFSFLPSAPAHI
jgi:hypothetical protein